MAIKSMSVLLFLCAAILAHAAPNTQQLDYDQWMNRGCNSPQLQWLRDYAVFHKEQRDKPDARFLAYVSVSGSHGLLGLAFPCKPCTHNWKQALQPNALTCVTRDTQAGAF